jgi:hypothetical protein
MISDRDALGVERVILESYIDCSEGQYICITFEVAHEKPICPFS